MSKVNWKVMIDDNRQAVNDFASGVLSKRNFVKSLTGEARTQAYKVESDIPATVARARARKALARVK